MKNTKETVTEIEVYVKGIITQIPMIVYEALLAVLFVGIIVVLFSRRERKVQKISLQLLVDWVVLIYCSAVVFRESREVSSIKLLPLWSYFDYTENSYLKEMAAVNFLNLVMFLPIGFLLKLGSIYLNPNHNNWKQALFVGFVISTFIEFSQFVFKRGLCETDDIIHNVAGCMLGYAISSVIVKLKIKYV